MEKYTISIIVPVYNVEKHIKQSIDSILNQTYRNLEIILVDDGSKDDSGKICDEYSIKDNRIKVIHKVNGGLSSARNAGLDIATGKYVMFIDSDDFYENNSCELLYNEIEKQNADYVIGNYIHTTYEGEKWNYPLFNVKGIEKTFKLSINDYEKSMFVMNSVVWNKIFRRDFIEKYNMRFEIGAFAEDAIFTIFCYTHSDNGYYINDIVYNYRQNRENSSISTNCTKQYFMKINDAYQIIFNCFKTTNSIGFYRYFYARILPYLLCKIIDTNELKTNDDFISVLKMLTWYFKQKQEYKITVINPELNNIVDDIVLEKYESAIIRIKQLKEIRKNMSLLEKEKFYIPTEKLYSSLK